MHSEHMLQGVISPGWEADIDRHVRQLGEVLEIPGDKLDYQLPSLVLVEGAIVRHWQERPLDELRAKLFSPLLAYTGEMIRRSVDGEWLILLDEPTDTLEPWIVDALQQRYDIMRILNPFFGDLTKLGLKAMVEVMPRLAKKKRS